MSYYMVSCYAVRKLLYLIFCQLFTFRKLLFYQLL